MRRGLCVMRQNMRRTGGGPDGSVAKAGRKAQGPGSGKKSADSFDKMLRVCYFMKAAPTLKNLKSVKFDFDGIYVGGI